MNIPFCRSENICVSQEGRAIALLYAERWRKEGKTVSWEETTKCISASYTEAVMLCELPQKGAANGSV